jgi:hypothetical protein
VGTHITFQISPAAASDLKERYAPLDQHDLANLPKWTVAARIMSLGGLAPTVTFKTPPPPPETPYWGQIIDRTRKDHARPIAEVQAEISERHRPPKQKSRPKIGEIDE